MKKSTKIVLIIVVALLVIGLIVLLAIKNSHSDSHKIKNSDKDIKEILNKEKEFLEAETVHQEFLDVATFKKSELDIEWADSVKTINIKGNLIKGYEALDNMDGMGEAEESYVLSEDGTVYRKFDGNYSKMTLKQTLKKIGVYYVNNGGECHGYSMYVADTDDGIYYFDSNWETGKVAFKKLDSVREFRMPVCYSGDKSKFEAYGSTSTKGQFHFDGLVVKDKITKKELVVKHAIYAENGGYDKFYLVTEDDTLYILTEKEEFAEAVAKVKVEFSESKNSEDEDVDIKITYDDIVISMKNVRNNP